MLSSHRFSPIHTPLSSILWGSDLPKRHLCASECGVIWGNQHCNLHILFSDRKCDFAHANTLHLTYIQGYNTILPNSPSLVTVAVFEWCLGRHQVFTSEVWTESTALSKLQTKMMQLNFAGLWVMWEATTWGADWHRATLPEIHYTIYIYKTTVLPNHSIVRNVENLKVQRQYSTVSYTVKNEQNWFCFPLRVKTNIAMIALQSSVLALNTTIWTRDEES